MNKYCLGQIVVINTNYGTSEGMITEILPNNQVMVKLSDQISIIVINPVLKENAVYKDGWVMD